MMAAGFLDEVRPARTRRPAPRPALDALRGLPPSLGRAGRRLERSRDHAERGIFATRQLAKRQITWLRSMPERRVVQADAPDALWRRCWRAMQPLLLIASSLRRVFLILDCIALPSNRLCTEP
jgi:tRNA A37 N6-isopentenylltransferase MiaA